MPEKTLLRREEVKKENTWAMEDMFAEDAAWEKEYKDLEALIPELQKFQGHLEESPAVLYDAMRLYYKADAMLNRLFVYATQKLHEDTANSVYQDKTARIQNLLVSVSETASYFEPEILSIDQEKIGTFIAEKKELEEYRRNLEVIQRNRPYVLDQETERLLSRAADMGRGAENIFSMFNDADIKFGTVVDKDGNEHELSHGKYTNYLMSEDRILRKSAFESYYKEFIDLKNTLAAVYTTQVKKDQFFAGARKFASSRAKSLHYSAIPESVYDNLIETIHEYLPVMHSYVSLRKKALDVQELHMYDVYAPMVSDVAKEIPFEEAKQMVLDGLKPLGEEYQSILKEAFAERWIDVYENKGKRSGAYSWGAYGTHPYVLLNFNGMLDSVFTLAHEMGHALHTYYSNQNQPYQTSDYKLFVAEVASTCNEALLMRQLLSVTEDKKERAYLINYFLESFKGTVFRQTMFAEFENEVHKMAEAGEALNAEVLCSLYGRLNAEYFGPDMVQDEEIAMEWSRIPHFYDSFYVYQYATGFSAAMALSARILNEGPEAVEDYKKFLKGGDSQDPIALLKIAGVDMTTAEPVRSALEIFKDLIRQMEELIC